MQRRAVGVVRVSRVSGRREDGKPGERFVSPGEQRERIKATCEREGLRLVAPPFEELDTSGGAPLERRDGLRQAVEMVEAREADVVVVAYFDRLVRKLTVQDEVVGRVEQAGGRVLAADFGEVRSDTASRWLSSTMLGMVAEYLRRATQERVAGAQRDAVARGVPPFAKIPPGIRKREDDGTLELDENAPVIREAFELRADGKSLMEIRDFLARHGIERTSIGGVQAMLANRLYRGELHFGKLVNPTACEPIVDEITWRRAQSTRLPRGPRPKNPRLLARLGVLRCATCKSRLVVSTRTTRGRKETMYRCPVTSPCDRRVTISADLAERTLTTYVKSAIDDVTGRATHDGELLDQARSDVHKIESELEAFVQAFDGDDDLAAVVRRKAELREERERRLDRLADLEGRVAPDVTVTGADWERLTLDEQRALVKAVVDRALVHPGKGSDRVEITAREA
jgi:DNA invertase Pin-like site-specific DNA recombinase